MEDLLDLSRMLCARPSNWNETLPRMPDGSQALKAWYDASQANVAYQDGAASFTAACKHYLSRADNASLRATDVLEIGCFVRLDVIGGGIQSLIAKGESYGAASYLDYRLAYDGTRFTFAVSDGTTVTVIADTGTAPVINTWYFLRAGRKANGTLFIQRDGGAEITAADAPQILPTAALFRLGNLSTAYLSGRMDSAYVTKRISTTAEATALATPRRYADLTAANGLDVFQSNLVAWYDLDQATGATTWSDSAGTNHLTFTADPIISPTVLNGGFETRGTNGGLTSGVVSATRARTSNVATVTTTLPHGFVSTNVASAITGFADTSFNGTAKTITRVDDYTLTYASTGDAVGATADTGGRFATDVFGSWTETVAGSSTIAADAAAPYAGTYAARLDVDAANSWVSISRPAALVTGKRYTVTMRAKASSAGVTMSTTDSSGASPITLTTSYELHASTWVTASDTVFIKRLSAAASNSIYIDSVTLVSAELVSAAGIAQGPCADTNPVAKLLDSSGFGRTLTQTDMTKRLVWRTNQQNGLPALVGTGVDDSLMIASDLVGVGDVTVFCTFRATGWGGSGSGRLIDTGKFLAFGHASGYLGLSSNGTTIITSANASIALNTTYVLVVTRTSAGVTNFYINGVLSGTANQSSGTPAWGTVTYLGNSSAGTRGFDGILPDLGVYGVILTAPQIAALTKKLKTTWGIA